MALVEDLTEEEAYLYAILTDPSGIEQAEFSWVDEDAPENVWRAWPFQWKWFRCEDRLQIEQCFPTGTLILTERGQVPIEDVELGDMVLTHEGRWKPVTYHWDRGEQDTIVLKGHGHPGLTVTADHKFFLGDRWGSPVVGDKWASPRVFPTSEVPPLPSRTYAPGRPSNIPKDISSPEFLWLYGLYLAEGSCCSSFGKGGVPNRTTFSVNTSEVADVEAMLDKVGLRYNTQPIRGEECSNVIVNSRPLATWFAEHGGSGARHKRLASWVLGLSSESRQAVFDGASYGDGCAARSEYSTTSRSLAVGIKLLVQSLGHFATFRSTDGRTSTINGRVVQGGIQYVVGLTVVRGDHHDRVVVDELHTWAPIKSQRDGPRVHCYDLEVADDHSFVAEGIVVSNCARAVGKSMSLRLRACAFPFLHPGQEMLITAPELVHLNPIIGYVEDQLLRIRLTRELLPKNANHGITHRPFEAKFLNGASIFGRIPQRDGRGVKGTHPKWLELDEGQDYPQPGWTELIETLNRGTENAAWRAHGVTRGVRDFFYKFTQPTSGWTVHRYSAMWRPTWSDQERIEKIEQYGSKNSPDYRRNILGAHGDATQPIFVLSRLMSCVDDDQSSDYNQKEYYNLHINAERIEDVGGDILQLLDFPAIHKNPAYVNYWAGMDVGFTRDPSEILVMGEMRGKKDKESVLKLLTRIHLERVRHGDQALAILHTIKWYEAKAFTFDSTGLGLPLFQDIQDRWPGEASVIKGYNFSSKILVDFDSTIEVDEFKGDLVKDAGIERNVLEFSTDCLRDLVDREQILLPWDTELITEFNGETYTIVRDNMTMYGKKSYSNGSGHTLDAARMLILGKVQTPIEEFTRQEKYEPITPVFVQF